MGIQIKTWITSHVRELFPDRNVISNYADDRSSQWYRWIQVTVKGHNELLSGMHYEYYQDPRRTELVFHFEQDYATSKFLALRRYVQKETAGIADLEWFDHQNHAKTGCWLKVQCTDSEDQLIYEFKRLMEILDPIIDRGMKEAPSIDLLLTRHLPSKEATSSILIDKSNQEKQDVRFIEGSFADLMSVNLNIPAYQRNYCWTDSNIENLWDSLANSNGDIHLGNIILQENNGNFDIIDGQQRLTTLTLFAMAHGYTKPLPLLKGYIRSSQSVDNIANAKYVIKKLCQRREKKIAELFSENEGKSIRFGFLVLGPDTGLDLAYTFFSSQNSKGVPLTDYDLLKAHHLQYILQSTQARHLASKWDKLVSASAVKKSLERKAGGDLKETLGKHLLRLRKWMRLEDLPTEGHIVRDEFVAAPVIAAIPPFGEEFDFYEKIQGGTHFFAYSDDFVEQYKMFRRTEVVQILDDILTYSSHRHYNDVIETLLFGYFVKFKTKYLAEAFFVISSIIADDRYSSGYMRRKRLMEHARNSRLIMMVDQATSPTFFLAEAINAIKINPLTLSDEEMSGKRLEFYQEMRKGIQSLMPLVSEESIRNKIIEIYEF